MPSIIHSGDHRGLLSSATTSDAIPADVDAIIVPSARTSPHVRHAARLAAGLNCVLVVLCSKRARVTDIVADADARVVLVSLVAVDLPGALPAMPALRTSALLRGTVHRRRTDVSHKRNVGLSVARMAGWDRVVFLDDDITVPDPTDLRRAAGLLTSHDSVGLAIDGYPDNSVVCHANRRTGGRQTTFVGGGALAVPAGRTDAFFPDVYNEDWFFLLGDAGLRQVARIGTAIQQPYDPFASPDRARGEELGDTLAEGVFALLERGGRVADADERYWTEFLRQRLGFIDDILRRTAIYGIDHVERWSVQASLRAARGRLRLITPGLCVRYIRAWREDRHTWSRHLAELPLGLSVEGALRHLGLEGRFTTSGPGSQRFAASAFSDGPDVRYGSGAPRQRRPPAGSALL
jgi:glycosyltransferase involved in cell wall biosynthesis